MDNQNICKFSISRASDLICTSYIFETAGSQAKWRKAENNLLGLVISGSGKFCCAENTFRLEGGTLFFVPKAARFRIDPEDRLYYYYIDFFGRRAEEYVLRLELSETRCVFPGNTALIPLWQNGQQLAEEGNIDMVCEAVVLYSLAGLHPEKAGSNDLLARMMLLTQERFTDAELSLTTLAEELGYDAKYLSAFFKKKKGLAFTGYLRELRIRHAAFLMEEGLVSVKSIALLSGFRDPLYFSKVFTQAEGITPKAYIANMQKNKI